MMNHHPVQQGIWFPYDGGRYKDYYDLRLKTGEIIQNCYPNGNSWFPHSNKEGRNQIKDEEVAEIRLKPDCEIHRWGMKGQNRIKRTLSLFAEWVPPWPEGFPTMEQLATEVQIEVQEAEEDRLEAERNKAKAMLEQGSDAILNEYKDRVQKKLGEVSSMNGFVKNDYGDDFTSVDFSSLPKPVTVIDLTGMDKRYTGKNDGNQAAIDAAEEKRKRKQARNLRNKK